LGDKTRAHKGLEKAESYNKNNRQSFPDSFDKCLTRMPNMRVNLSEQIYGMICESRMLYGAVIFFGGGEGGRWNLA